DLDDTGRAEALVDGAIAALGGGIDVAVIAQGLLGDQLATERDYAEAEPVIRTNLLSVLALLVPGQPDGGGRRRADRGALDRGRHRPARGGGLRPLVLAADHDGRARDARSYPAAPAVPVGALTDGRLIAM